MSAERAIRGLGARGMLAGQRPDPAGVLADIDALLEPPEAHPGWCKCQRVCGGDQ